MENKRIGLAASKAIHDPGLWLQFWWYTTWSTIIVCLGYLLNIFYDKNVKKKDD